MIYNAFVRSTLGALLLLWSAATGFADNLTYIVKPPEVAVPNGIAMGQVRRVIQPFGNWTLICDENLDRLSKVCNVTQTIIDTEGATVFSWSLAATEDGEALFILRVSPAIGPAGFIKLSNAGGKQSVVAPIRACDDKTCVATMRLSPPMREQIEFGKSMRVSFETDRKISLLAPLSGLKEAVAAIN